jgi:hypothetical protein
MRTVFLLPLTAVMAVAAGCGAEGREQAARSLPQRDLTLATQAAEVKIASPVELQQLRTQYRTVRPPRREPRRSGAIETEPAPVAVAPLAVLGAGSAVVLPASPSVAESASTASEAANDRELLPGKTVTIIPASSGPSPAPPLTDDFPTAQGGTFAVRGGGRCPPRGRRPGIGIATAPRPDFR